ncbi:FAD/FMN-containing dehydrogenase [Apiospora phragmitis]|uniref:FAD/FMN-containing dehydrogenase n=1 Tax=Apiospora phragmitis TaxID=2905665 RepID=A0ABR1U6W4_9PEZI
MSATPLTFGLRRMWPPPSISLESTTSGSCFFGRSTGAGAIAAWTHHLKDITKLEWRDDTYQGPTFKLGAGIQGIDAITAAKNEGLVVVAGYCNTVGLAGGWTHGTGHSPLTTTFGLGADQTLEFDVVTADGDIIKASRTENSDLYWALSGGGPGTFGVVTAVTIRAYEDLPVGGMGVYFDPTDITTDKYWTALRTLYSILPAVTDAGMHITIAYNTTMFIISGVTAYNQTASAVTATMAPFVDILDSLEIPYQSWLTDSPSYLEHAEQYGDISEATLLWQAGERLVPRRVFEDNFEDLLAVLRELYDNDVYAGATVLIGMLHPWDREPSAWADMGAMQRRLTGLLPALERVTPGSAAYVNEGDPFQEDWKETFFGPNYDRLLAIKDKYDPDGVFYARKTVGSDRWDVAEDGRMCRM